VAAVLYAALRLTRASPGRQRGGSLAVLLQDRTLRVTIGLAAVSIAMSGFQTAALYSVVTTGLGLPSTFLGVLLSAQGAGSILGGLGVGRLIAWRGPVAVGTAGTVLFAASTLARCVPWWPVTVAAAVVGGVGLPWTLIAAVTAVQRHVPPALLGRAAATANTVMFGPIALALPLGSAAVHLGDRVPLVAAAATCLVTVTCFRSGRRGARWRGRRSGSVPWRCP
jgi:predicted MFS family arabinose efflux permease